jgi:GNAT superfamily N-acetyltransferase
MSETKFSDQNTITVIPATPYHWPDIEEFFAHHPCWCQYWRSSAIQYGRSSKQQLQEGRLSERRDALRNQLQESTPPGILAYIDGKLIGWCGIGPRCKMERLVRSRTIPAVDDRPVWSIVCFLVQSRYRKRGDARALLQCAIECARSYGVPALEAYPVDPKGKRIHSTSAYVGTRRMFEEKGFLPILETSARSAGLSRWLMRLEL